jgi:Glycosyltransferase family 87
VAAESAVRDARGTARPLGGRRAAAAAWRIVLGVAGATAIVLITIANLKGTGGFLFDFRGDLYGAGQAILHGHNPYHPGYLAALAATKHAGGAVSPTFALPVYPAPALLAAAPLALLPYSVAGTLFVILMVGAMISGLRLLGVRDWRCLALALASWPFVFGLHVGALGPALVLGTGLAWRFRTTLWTPAVAIAAVVAAKLFPWTLLIWLGVTRRFRTLALAVLIAALALLGGWAVIGFAGLGEYPRMLANLSFIERGAGTSLVSALLASGLSGAVAELVALSAAAALLALAYRFAQRPNGDGQALGLTVIAAMTASTIVWPHYYVLLFVPIALASPRLSPIWFVPLLTVLLPTPQGLVQVLLWLALEAVVVIHLCRSPTAERVSAEPATDATTRRAPGGSSAIGAGLRPSPVGDRAALASSTRP